MKKNIKVLAVILAAVTAMTNVAFAADESSAQNVIFGDADIDGVITSNDAALTLQYVLDVNKTCQILMENYEKKGLVETGLTEEEKQIQVNNVIKKTVTVDSQSIKNEVPSSADAALILAKVLGNGKFDEACKNQYLRLVCGNYGASLQAEDNNKVLDVIDKNVSANADTAVKNVILEQAQLIVDVAKSVTINGTQLTSGAGWELLADHILPADVINNSNSEQWKAYLALNPSNADAIGMEAYMDAYVKNIRTAFPEGQKPTDADFDVNLIADSSTEMTLTLTTADEKIAELKDAAEILSWMGENFLYKDLTVEEFKDIAVSGKGDFAGKAVSFNFYEK